METLKHEIKTCPRCHAAFECRAGTITNCQCAEVFLSQLTREQLSIQFEDCLCKHCLSALENEKSDAPDHTFPTSSAV